MTVGRGPVSRARTPGNTSSFVNGIYGALAINQSGNWTYRLDNSLANVQALAQGEITTDTFQVQVTDEHGASATQSINVLVTGTNDAPVLQNIGDNGTQTVDDINGLVLQGTMAFADVDLADSHTVIYEEQGVNYLGHISLSMATDSTGSGQGSISATYILTPTEYAAANGIFPVEQDYLVTLTDSHGATSTQVIQVPLAELINGINNGGGGGGPLNVSASVNGTAQEGQFLVANYTSNSNNLHVISYQWQSSSDGSAWSDITGANSQSYQVQEADENHQLRVVLMADDSNNPPVTASSVPTASVVDQPMSNPVVTISGIAQEAHTLTAILTTDVNGQTDSDQDSLAYQWQISTNNGATWGDIANANSVTYTASEADEHNLLRVQVTATDDTNQSVTIASAATAPVLDNISTIIQGLNGPPTAGQVLTAVIVGDGDGTPVGYQWQSLDGSTWSNIGGATGQTYLVIAADQGHSLRVIGTGEEDNGEIASATSAPTAPVGVAPAQTDFTWNGLSGGANYPYEIGFTVAPHGGSLTVNWNDGTGQTVSGNTAAAASYAHLYNAGFSGAIMITNASSAGTSLDSINYQFAPNHTEYRISGDNYMYPSISDNGQFLTFGDFDNANILFKDIFYYDVVGNLLTQIATGVLPVYDTNHNIITYPMQNLDPVISADGQHVLYDHTAWNGFGYGSSSLVYDAGLGTSGAAPASGSVLTVDGVSITVNGAGNGSIDGDGNLVAFYAQYYLTNEGPNGAPHSDVFTLNRSTNAVNLVSANAPGLSGVGGDFGNFWPLISTDGSTVVWTQYVDSFTSQIAVRHLTDGTFEVIPNSSTNGPYSSVSADGRYIAYSVSGLGGGDFVYDAVTNTTEQIGSQFGRVDISGDGRYVAFEQGGNIVVYDRVTHTTATESDFPGGYEPTISYDGRYLAYTGNNNTVHPTSDIVIVDTLPNINLTGTSSRDALIGNNASNVISGLGGDDLLAGGHGNDTLTGGTGADTFVFASGDGADIITDFSHAQGDRIDLTGVSGVSALGYIQSHATQNGADTLINFGNGDTLTLQNTSLASLTASDVALAPSPTTVIDFEAMDPTGNSGPTLGQYLAGYGITLTTTGAQAQVASDQAIYGGGIVQATTGHNVIGQAAGHPVSYTLTFASALSSFDFDRVTENAGPSGSSYPVWSATAYDAAGNVIATVGEAEQLIFSGSHGAAHYTLSGGNIAYVTFAGDDHGFDGFSNVLTDTWILTAAAVQAPVSGFTTLDSPGKYNTQAVGINDQGVIVGQADQDPNHGTGWSYNNGAFTTISAFGAQDTSAHAINDQGVIIGDYSPVRSTPRYGFVDTNGVFTSVVSDSPYPSTNADGINEAGVIVGNDYLHPGGARYSAYIDNHGAFTYLNAPGTINGAGDTFANDINNLGQVVGTYNQNANFASGNHGFIYQAGVYTTLTDPLAVNGTFAQGINDAGQVVGWYVDGSNKAHGFIETNGVYTTVDDPLGVNGSAVQGINNSGQIVGYYLDGANAAHGFVAQLNNPVNQATSDVLVANPQIGSTMTGGAGNDTFVFNIPPATMSTVTDFVHGQDILQINAAGFDHGLTTNATPTLFTGTLAGVVNGGTNGVFVFDNTNPTGGTLYYDADGGSATNAVAVVKLQGVSSLLQSDFHVV